MKYQLLAYIEANRSILQVGYKAFRFLRLFSAGRNSACGDVELNGEVYDLILRPTAEVDQVPGAEVWVVRGRLGRPIAQFAIHDAKIIELAFSVEPYSGTTWVLSPVQPPKDW